MHRQIHVDDLRKGDAQQRQKQSFRGFTEIGIFHRRAADDGGWINWIFLVGDAGHMKNRIVVGQRIKAGMIAERPFTPERLRRIDIAFDDDVRVRRHFDVDGNALDQFDAFLAQKTSK